MRRKRRIRKTVNVLLNDESNLQSRISRGGIRKDNTVKKVSTPAQVISNKSTPTLETVKKPKYFQPVKPIWKGETVYLIGGGPSLKGFKWNRLKGKRTIAINKAIEFWPSADAMYWTDGRVWTWLEKKIRDFKGLKFTIAPRGNYPSDIHVLRRGVKFGLETATDALAHGNNSGCAAINLAVHLGAKRIILLGYDMGNDGVTSHFHDGYPVPSTSPNIYKKQFLPAFDIIDHHLKGKDIQILNACPTSKLNTFKKITIEEALAFR